MIFNRSRKHALFYVNDHENPKLLKRTFSPLSKLVTINLYIYYLDDISLKVCSYEDLFAHYSNFH